MSTILEVSAYGEKFMIECSNDNEYYSVKNILDREWISFKVIQFENLSLPLVYADEWLKDYQ